MHYNFGNFGNLNLLSPFFAGERDKSSFHVLVFEHFLLDSFSKCLLFQGVVRVFVSFCVLVFAWAILSWCP